MHSNIFQIAGIGLALLAVGGVPNVAMAREGGNSSGGGKAIVCRDEVGHITTADLLDLYEAPALGLNVLYIDETLDARLEQIQQILSKSTPTKNYLYGAGSFNPIEGEFRAEVKWVRANLLSLPQGEFPSTTNDAHSIRPVPAGCQIEQLATYGADSWIRVNNEIYQKLSSTDQASFIVHEALYALARTSSHATDSDMVRALNGNLFATDPNPSSIKSFSAVLIPSMVWGGWAEVSMPIRTDGRKSLSLSASMNGCEGRGSLTQDLLLTDGPSSRPVSLSHGATAQNQAIRNEVTPFAYSVRKKTIAQELWVLCDHPGTVSLTVQYYQDGVELPQYRRHFSRKLFKSGSGYVTNEMVGTVVESATP